MRRHRPTWGLLVAFGLIMAPALSACAGWPLIPPTPVATGVATSPPAPPPTEPGPLPTTSTEPVTDGPLRIVFTNEASSINQPYPIGVAIETPHLQGASAAAIEAFDRAFADDVADELSDLQESLAERPPLAQDNTCDASVIDGYFVSTLSGIKHTVSTDGGRASVTSLFGHMTGCSGIAMTASSVTVDLATGQDLDLENVANPDSSRYRDAVTKLATQTCADLDVVRSDLTDDDTAFTPTDAGLVLTWGDSDIEPDSCGTVSVTVPWADAGEGTPIRTSSPEPSPEPTSDWTPDPSPWPTTEPLISETPTEPPQTRSPAPRKTSKPKPKAQAPCPAGAQLFAGLDPRVCGPAPAGARAPVEVDGGALAGVGYVLYAPSGNIACDLYDDAAWCYAKQYTFAPPRDTRPAEERNVVQWVPNVMVITGGSAQAGAGQGGVSTAMALTDRSQISQATLPYGQAVALGRIACVSQEIGISCWDTSTKHGFSLAKNDYSTW